MIRQLFLFVLLAVLVHSCAPSRYVKPLKNGEQEISASLGGPLINFAGAVIPVPNTSIGYGRGVSDDLTVFADLYSTSLAFGVFQVDGGATFRVLGSDSLKYGLSTSASFNFSVDRWEGNAGLWPQWEVNAYYDLGRKDSYVYGGCGTWIELSGKKAHDIKQPDHFLFYPNLGIHWQRKKWSFDLQTRWLAPSRFNTPNAVDYIGVSGKGAMGLYFGFHRKF